MSPNYATVLGAVVTMRLPMSFGTAIADANRLLARCRRVSCDRCKATGVVPGKRRPRKCRRCGGEKHGYAFGQAIYWTGWPEDTGPGPAAAGGGR